MNKVLSHRGSSCNWLCMASCIVLYIESHFVHNNATNFCWLLDINRSCRIVRAELIASLYGIHFRISTHFCICSSTAANQLLDCFSFAPSTVFVIVHPLRAQKTRYWPSRQCHLDAFMVIPARWSNTWIVADRSKKRCRNKSLHHPSLFVNFGFLFLITCRGMDVIMATSKTGLWSINVD